MIKHFKFWLMVIGAFFFVACSEKSPQNIVDDYIEAWDNGNITELKSLVSKNISQEIDASMENCIYNSSEKTLDTKLKFYLEEVNTIWRKNNPFEAMGKTKGKSEKINKELDVLKENKNFSLEEATLKMGLILLNNIDGYEKVEKEMSPVGYKMLALMFANKMRMNNGDIFGSINKYSRNTYFKKLILNELENNDDKTMLESKKMCKEKIFKIGQIKSSSFIETKEISVDQKIVRIELIFKNGDTRKGNIQLEKINSKWVVTSYLKSY